MLGEGGLLCPIVQVMKSESQTQSLKFWFRNLALAELLASILPALIRGLTSSYAVGKDFANAVLYQCLALG